MNHDVDIATALKSSLDLAGIPIRPDVADQGDAPPYIVFAEVALPDGTYALSGESSLVPARYQIDVYSLTRVEANVLAAAVAAKITEAFGGIVLNRQSLYEPDTRLRRVLLDLSIWFENA
jgi:Protein of unknown function (DUF3168)